jgi:flavin-dependent dehydrogenase
MSALDSIGMDCREVLAQKISGLRVEGGGEVLDFDFNSPENDLPGNVYREEFDYLITQCAAESGANVMDSTRIRKIVLPDTDKGQYKVLSEKGIEECQIVLGADGYNSIVRKCLGVTYPKSKVAVTIEAEVPVDKKTAELYDGRNYYNLGYVRRGYSWAFPKGRGRTINVGVIALVEEAKSMRKPFLHVWKDFLKNLEGYKNQNVEPHGSILPYQGTTDKLGDKNILLLGDAAGLVEPLGGEGIPYALESGINAAQSVKHHIEQGSVLLEVYTDLMKDVMEEINIYGIKMHENFFVKNRLKTLLKMTKKNKEMLNIMRKMMSRSISYKQAVESLSPLKIILYYLKTII